MKLHPVLFALCFHTLLPGVSVAAGAPGGGQSAAASATAPAGAPASLQGSASAPAPATAAPAAAQAVPAAPQVDARSFLLIDFNTGLVLAESRADERLEPASLTKIMTGYTVYRELAAEHVRLTDMVLISENAWRTGGSKMFVEVGKQVVLEELLKGMIIQSGNDASVALAEHVAGSEQTFSDLMNANARRLGMNDSHFVNVTGLPDPNHYTTARDIARVTAALIREFPQFYVWDGTKEYEYNGIKQQNRNRLLWRDPTVDGVKTGYTENAGYCLVASAKRDNMRLISVVMGSKNPELRAVASLELLNYGFRFFQTNLLYPAGQPLQQVRVFGGDLQEVPVGPATDVYATIPRGRYAELAPRVDKVPTLKAPVSRGTQVGDIVVLFAGQEITRVPLVVLQDVGEGSLWQRARDAVIQWF